MIVSDHVILLDVFHLCYVAIVVALAAITYRLIEQPGRRYFNRFADGMATTRRGRLAPVLAHPSSCQSHESR